MKNELFKEKFVSTFCLLFFILGGFIFIPLNIHPFAYNVGVEHNFFVISILIFAIVIFILLISKKRITIRLINIYLILVLLINIKSFIALFFNQYYDYSHYYLKGIITIFLITLLYLVNKYKVSFKQVGEINNIGKE
ncbi:hypothetical protein [Chryseobacterium sp. MYb328]|uniref:hypothetical protein n=1 Tax=Chryseobacterium sp. MYb328 TaxID=2745231 RepID=UPI00309C45D0